MARMTFSRILGIALLGGALVFQAVPLRAESSFEKLLHRFGGKDRYDNVASSNGRLEAQSVDVATKYAGRLTEVIAHEGDIVEAGAVMARIDDRDTQAQLNAAKATVLRARASKQIAEAAVMQAESALSVAQTNYKRISQLNADGHAADSVLDDATNTLKAAEASLASAKAQIADADAMIAASEADVERLNVSLDDLTIRAPLKGRVLYRLHEPGEVVAAGSSIFTMLDLTQVYMNIYLTAPVVGPLAVNDEARLILDPVPEYVIPARVTFIAPESQFTPKAVETQEEREELVFRVKLTIPRELLEKFEDQVKVGVRGLGFVRTDPEAPWPADLQIKLPK
ncbi:MAG: HlyD family secretion protein [Pseudodonghicola sp.]